MKIGIIGIGVMGEAILRVLRAKDRQSQIFIFDKDPQKSQRLARIYHVRADNQKTLLARAEIVILAVKPQDFPKLAEQIANKINKDTIIVSIAAGMKIKKIQKLFVHQRVVRIMPNLGLAVNQGIGAWLTASAMNQNDKAKVKRLLDMLLENFEVKNENVIDAVTAISGSGPAYFFFFAQSLAQAALAVGLTASQGRRLVKKTLLAAAHLQTGQEYADLIKKVASKKGTTEAALKQFQKFHLAKIIESAVKAAYQRAKELSK